MPSVPPFPEHQLRELAKSLAEAVSHQDLTELLRQTGLPAVAEGPRWDRMLKAFLACQRESGSGAPVAAFVQVVLDPVRFTAKPDQHAEFRETASKILAFSGLVVGMDGKLRKVPAASTLTEAEERAGSIRRSLAERGVHPTVLKYCTPELLQDNYFHAVLEATKSLADTIRDRTGLSGDGADIIDATFSTKKPLLAINSLQTETEQSQQKGFANLLKGIFGTFRNVTAHAPKVRWALEEKDALDAFTIISFAHRQLDEAVRTHNQP